MRETARYRRGKGRGQAAVESALTLPLSLFVMLGLLQLSLAYNARLLLDYGAFRAAHMGSAGMCDCSAMTTAVLAALVPVAGRGRTYNADAWIAAYQASGYSRNQSARAPGLPVVSVRYQLSALRHPFDDLRGGASEKLHVQADYFYELGVPFVNWVIARFFLAQYEARYWRDFVDPIKPPAQADPAQLATRSASAAFDKAVLEQYFEQGVYVLPLHSSWSMRMFSQCRRTARLCPPQPWGERP